MLSSTKKNSRVRPRSARISSSTSSIGRRDCVAPKYVWMAQNSQ